MAIVADAQTKQINVPSTQPKLESFDTIFDENDDEWWNEAEPPEKIAKPDRTTQWPRVAEAIGTSSTRAASRIGTRKVGKRYSVQKPVREKSRGRQKKQNALAGIKVVTTFTRHQAAKAPVQLQPSNTMPHMGYFVDLAALQALTGDANQVSGKLWRSKTKKPKGLGLKRASVTMPSISGSTTRVHEPSNRTLFQQKAASNLAPSPLRSCDDLSPNDRPIMIGISIPSSDVSLHSLSPQTASSEISRKDRTYDRARQSPDTPTIIITPAQEAYGWSPISPRPRATSSVYSQAVDNYEPYMSDDAPPVPKVPASVLRDEQQRIAVQKSYFSPDSDVSTAWEDDDTGLSPSKSRVMSTCTIFEEDESPVLVRAARAVSMAERSNAIKHASVSTVATRRRSRGWWNYITTPFLTRSNTLADRSPQDQHPPALPSLAVAAARARDVERDGKSWEKQFSPLTPETSTTIHSDHWWDADPKDKESPIVQETRHRVQESSGTLPIVLSEVAGFGTASSMSSIDGSPDLSSSRSFGESSNTLPAPTVSDPSTSRAIQTNNPFSQPTLNDLNATQSATQSITEQSAQSSRISILRRAQPPVHRAQSPSCTPPPPPYSPSPSRNPRVRAIFPPDHALSIHQPVSPGPISPGMQEAMASPNAIPMSTVPLTPPARRPMNLNSAYPSELPPRQQNTVLFTTDHLQTASKKAKKAEAKRRRYEKEDAVAHKAGGLWRGRGCVPMRGCYGRKGAEGRKKRRCVFWLVLLFLAMLILIVALATTLSRKPSTNIQPSQWVNLTGFPPIFAGLSTIIAPDNTVTQSGCVLPSTQWSCDLPKEDQASIAPNQPNQPNFFLNIQWDNSSSANETFKNVTDNPDIISRSIGGNAVSAGQFIRSILIKVRDTVTFVPSPAAPSDGDDFFLGNTTDDIVSNSKAGEPTPFYISFFSTISNSTTDKRSLSTRQSADNTSDTFPNLTSIIPAPSLNSDGTASPANLLPLPFQQPIRLYDRGLPTEHYGFYSYFDRSIFLKSLNSSDGTVPDDDNGGATESEAAFRCTWTQTRFLFQIWTRMNTTSRLLNSTGIFSINQDPAHDISQPGLFPYPVTVTLDRHGGDPNMKMLYCYSMDNREGIVKDSGKIMSEDRSFGGTLINPAALLFDTTDPSDPNLGGFDGGTGGCGCQWRNWQSIVNA